MKKLKIVCLTLALLGFLPSCSKYSLHLTKLSINENSLASVFAKTKDPRKKHPIIGEELMIYWGLRKNVFEKAKGLILEIIYKNFETETVYYPIESVRGIKGFFVIGEKFKESQGLLTYRAFIVDEDKKPLMSWTHKMWFNLLKVKEFENSSDEQTAIDAQLSLDLYKDQ